VVTVDRDLPNFSGYTTTGIRSGALIYYDAINFSGESLITQYSTDYLDESVLSFLENNQCPTVVFPFWNMSIVYTEEIAGVQLADRKYQQFNTRTYAGFRIIYSESSTDIRKTWGHTLYQ
jgi:hypothetical protein